MTKLMASWKWRSVRSELTDCCQLGGVNRPLLDEQTNLQEIGVTPANPVSVQHRSICIEDRNGSTQEKLNTQDRNQWAVSWKLQPCPSNLFIIAFKKNHIWKLQDSLTSKTKTRLDLTGSLGCFLWNECDAGEFCFGTSGIGWLFWCPLLDVVKST